MVHSFNDLILSDGLRRACFPNGKVSPAGAERTAIIAADGSGRDLCVDKRLRPLGPYLCSPALAAGSSDAADLIWEVENPFRFFKPTKSFALHEAAYNGGARRSGDAAPPDIIWRTERRLNDPDCKDPSHPDKCAATAGKRYQQSRLGWAAQTVGETCYDSNGHPRRYSAVCERKYSWGSAKEDYVLPEAHTVTIRIAPEHARGRHRRLHLELAAAQGRRQGRKQEAHLQGQADDRARSARARPQRFPGSASR